MSALFLKFVLFWTELTCSADPCLDFEAIFVLIITLYLYQDGLSPGISMIQELGIISFHKSRLQDYKTVSKFASLCRLLHKDSFSHGTQTHTLHFFFPLLFLVPTLFFFYSYFCLLLLFLLFFSSLSSSFLFHLSIFLPRFCPFFFFFCNIYPQMPSSILKVYAYKQRT